MGDSGEGRLPEFVLLGGWGRVTRGVYLAIVLAHLNTNNTFFDYLCIYLFRTVFSPQNVENKNTYTHADYGSSHQLSCIYTSPRRAICFDPSPPKGKEGWVRWKKKLEKRRSNSSTLSIGSVWLTLCDEVSFSLGPRTLVLSLCTVPLKA